MFFGTNFQRCEGVAVAASTRGVAVRRYLAPLWSACDGGLLRAPSDQIFEVFLNLLEQIGTISPVHRDTSLALK